MRGGGNSIKQPSRYYFASLLKRDLLLKKSIWFLLQESKQEVSLGKTYALNRYLLKIKLIKVALRNKEHIKDRNAFILDDYGL